MLIYCNQFLFVNISFNSYSNLVFMPIGRDFLNSCTDFSLHRNVLHENVHVAKTQRNRVPIVHFLVKKSLFNTGMVFVSHKTTANSSLVSYTLLFYLYIVFVTENTSQDFLMLL